MFTMEEKKEIADSIYSHLFVGDGYRDYYLNIEDIQIRDGLICLLVTNAMGAEDVNEYYAHIEESLKRFIGHVDAKCNPLAYSYTATMIGIIRWCQEKNPIFYLDVASTIQDTSLNDLIRLGIKSGAGADLFIRSVDDVTFDGCFKSDDEEDEEVFDDRKYLTGCKSLAKFVVGEFPDVEQDHVVLVEIDYDDSILDVHVGSLSAVNKMITSLDTHLGLVVTVNNAYVKNDFNHGGNLVEILYVNPVAKTYRSLLCTNETCCPAEGKNF